MEEAIDPITGIINWDCTCFKGKAHGPCGPLFREAFKFFVKNQDQPEKCQELMSILQECLDKHPDLYQEDAGDNDNGDNENAENIQENIQEN